jgi:hypothetical protein
MADDEMEEYEIVVALPLPTSIRTKEMRQPSMDLMGKLADMLLKEGVMRLATLRVMPTNPDVAPAAAVKDTLRSLQTLVTNLHDNVLDDGKMSLFFNDLCAVRDAVKNMKRTVAAIEGGDDLSKQAEEGLAKAAAEGRVRVITPENIDDVPIELLHSMAHTVAEKIGIDFDCLEHGMDRDKIVTWMKKHAFGVEGKAN